MKKIMLVLLVCLSACVFSGCVGEFAGVDELMVPPTINDDQFSIYSVLRSDGKVPDFLYPARGDIRIPVYLDDFDGDGEEEGFAFSTDPDSGGSLITFMGKKGDDWATTAQYSNSAGQVDKVIIEDITGDSVPEIIVGWGSYRSMAATVCVYRREVTDKGEVVNEYSLGYTYGDMIVTDFTGDGISELCTVTVHTTSENNQAVTSNAITRVYTFAGEKPYCTYTANLSKQVTEYTNFAFGTADNGKKILVVDGLTADGELITQLLTLNSDNSGIIMPMIYSELQHKYRSFARPSGMSIYPQDIDGDGYLELPYAKAMPGLGGEVSDEFMIYWMDYIGGSDYFDVSTATVVNMHDDYFMTVESEADSIVAIYHPDSKKYILNLAKLDEEGKVEELTALFALHKFAPGEATLDEIQSKYMVVDISEDGSIMAVEYSKDYEHSDWVKNIAESFSPVSYIMN